MYDMNDLFNSRDVVGCKLNQIIGSHKYTKAMYALVQVSLAQHLISS